MENMFTSNERREEAPLNRADEVKDVSIFGKSVPNVPISTSSHLLFPPIYEDPIRNHMANDILLIIS
jgi:hypothetical protein